MRVLIACDHIDYEGALHGGGRQLIELIQALEGSAVEPTVCILREATVLGRQLEAEGLPLQFFGDHRFNPVSLWRFVRTIRERRIDVLHLTDFGACTFGRIAGRLTRTPAIVQVIAEHTEHQARGFPRYVEWAYRGLARHTSHALAISDSVKAVAVRRMGFSADEVEVLHYPLPRYTLKEPTEQQVMEVRRRHGIPEGAPVIGTVTRFFPSKGIQYLLQAMPEVLARHPEARVLLVGQGPQESELRRRCSELGLEDRVVFAGFQRDVASYVGAFTISAIPSVEEGFGLVALEAQALGVPVVASRTGGLPDIVLDGETGLLVDPASPPQLAEGITLLLRDADARERMAAAARSRAQRFSIDRYADRLTEIYRGLSARHRASLERAS